MRSAAAASTRQESALPDRDASKVSLDESLPAKLRGSSTTISKVSAGLSGAGVYRVDASAGAFVLKIAADADTVDAWRRRVRVQQLAADAGLAPRIVHVDEERRAVVSDFVADRGFIAMYRDPRTHGAAMQQLGESVRRIHALPLPDDAEPADGLNFLAGAWSGLAGDFPLPAFVRDAAQQLLAEQPPSRDRAIVMSHNDINPTNLAHDGTRLLFLDWDTAAPNDPWFDLASIAVFLRMDADSCRRLIGAYDGASVTSLPARFDYNRRLMAAMCGILGLRMARMGGHAGATGAASLEATPGLGEFYQQLRAGQLNLATPEGQWSFGLALVKESVVLRENADG
jgi:aminoglycoside phosphotransferase (APT) family kinase protein